MSASGAFITLVSLMPFMFHPFLTCQLWRDHETINDQPFLRGKNYFKRGQWSAGDAPFRCKPTSLFYL
jgi:hypothetical protein